MTHVLAAIGAITLGVICTAIVVGLILLNCTVLGFSPGKKVRFLKGQYANRTGVVVKQGIFTVRVKVNELDTETNIFGFRLDYS